ncbi:extensin-like domain-containing protein [Cucumibacter marinus]|uniref:extensin-like domain-containing protein n=1 Tax=Cucumibacter marinus TaxID=1121252 RepID=UPI00138ADF52|nr:extensin family protein [Cucumibacter marinus]
MASPAVPPPPPEDQKPAPHRQACPAMLSGLIDAQAGMPITEGACAITTPLTLTGVRTVGGDVRLSGGPVLGCAMATETAQWLKELDRYARAALGSRIAEMATGPGYVCRRRNNADAGKVSEHGFGNALDISGFVFEDGTRISVLTDWVEPTPASDGEDEARAVPPEPGPKQAFLRHAKRLACARFATVLSPTANALHKDHLHFDLGCHGRTCTAQICE